MLAFVGILFTMMGNHQNSLGSQVEFFILSVPMPYMNCLKNMKSNARYTVNESKLHRFFPVIFLFTKSFFPWMG